MLLREVLARSEAQLSDCACDGPCWSNHKGSIPNWATDLGKENAEVPGSIPGEPVA